MARWGKLAAGFHANPKAVAAGLLGRAVFVFALDQNAADDMNGRIRIGFFGANYLARLLDITPQQAEEGFNAAIASDLLAVDGKYVRIVGWDEEWQPPATSASRTAAWRERKTANTGDVTVTPGDASDGLDKSRSEKIREEILSSGEPTPVPLADGTGRHKKLLDARAATETVVAAFNKAFGRNLSPKGWEESVRKLLAKGFSEPELRAVVWWAAREWADDPDMRAKVTPKTLLKLTSSQGYRTFREYLSCAGERWREEHGGDVPPWERAAVQPKLGAVA